MIVVKIVKGWKDVGGIVIVVVVSAVIVVDVVGAADVGGDVVIGFSCVG